MNQSAPQAPLTKSQVETREIILQIKKRIWLYLFIVVLGGAFSFYLLKFHFLNYSATASFFVNDHSIITSSTTDLRPLENIIAGDNFNRIYQMINSAVMQKHLINKFNLISHYNIDSTKEFHYQLAIETIRSNIVVKKNPYNSISVTVKDKHRYLSAEMANEITLYIETLYEEFYVRNLKNKVKISEAYVEQMEKDNTNKTIGIDSLVTKINNLITAGKHDQKNDYYLLSHQQMLSELISLFQRSSIDLVNSQKLYNLTLQALNFKNFPTITVLQTAMPAPHSIAIKAALFSILVMFLIMTQIVFFTYIVLHYRNYFILIFTGK
jgi:hypothetical protein